MTKSERELLLFLNRFIQQHGYAPTYGEIKSGLGWKSTAKIHVHLHGLQGLGYIHIYPRIMRGIEMLQEPPKTLAERGCCPTCGQTVPHQPQESTASSGLDIPT